MSTKILDRWEEILSNLVHKQDKTLKAVGSVSSANGCMDDFEDMLSRQASIRARMYIIDAYKETYTSLEVNFGKAAEALTDKDMLKRVMREVVIQSTNTRLHPQYKAALKDMYDDLVYLVTARGENLW